MVLMVQSGEVTTTTNDTVRNGLRLGAPSLAGLF
jgi:hypothetical protein